MLLLSLLRIGLMVSNPSSKTLSERSVISLIYKIYQGYGDSKYKDMPASFWYPAKAWKLLCQDSKRSYFFKMPAAYNIFLWCHEFKAITSFLARYSARCSTFGVVRG